MPTPSPSRHRSAASRLLAAFASLLVALTATIALSPAAQADRGVHVVFLFERTTVTAGDPLRGAVEGFDEYDRDALAEADLVLRSAATPAGPTWDVASDGTFTVDTTTLSGTVTLELVDAAHDRWLAEHDVVVDTTPWTPELTVTAPDVALGEETVVTVQVDDPLRRIDDEVDILVGDDLQVVRFVNGVAQARFTMTPGDHFTIARLHERGARQYSWAHASHLVQGIETNFQLNAPRYAAVGQVVTLEPTHDTDLPLENVRSLDTEVCILDELTVSFVAIGDCIIQAELATGHPTWHPAQAYSSTHVGVTPTTLEVTAPTTIVGDEVHVTARVLADGKPVPVDGTFYVTAGDRSFSHWFTNGTLTFGVGELELGTHDVEVAFHPNLRDWAGAVGSVTASVVAAPTTLDVRTTLAVMAGDDADVRLEVVSQGRIVDVAGTFTIVSGSYRAEQATTDGTARVRVPSGSVGDQQIDVTFTPSAPGGESLTGSTVVEVIPHETWLEVDAPAEAAVGAGAEIDVVVGTDSKRPLTGTVTLHVGETTLTSSVVDSRAAFSLDGVPVGTHAVSAAFTPGTTDFVASTSTRTTLRMTPAPPPRIKAQIVSAHPVTASGWYRNAVTVKFTCTVPRAPLAAPCPAPVTLKHGRHAAIERTITTTTGQRATVRVPAINIDLKAPQIKASLLAPLTKTAHFTAPKRPKCVAGDSTSGVAKCTIKATTKGDKVTWTATAVDRAGNVSTRTATTTLVKARIQNAQVVKGVAEAKANAAHTLQVRSTNRPTLSGHTFTKVNKNTWRTTVRFTTKQAGKTVTLKPKSGKSTLTVKVKVTR